MRTWPRSLVAIALPIIGWVLFVAFAAASGDSAMTIFMIVFMVLGGPIMLILFVLPTLGFAGIAIEVFRKQVAWGWLVLPAAYFGLYGVLLGIERWEMLAVGRDINARNATVSVSFRPQSQALFLEDLTALSLARHDLHVVYSKDRRSASQGTTANYLIGRSTCNDINSRFAGLRDNPNGITSYLVDHDGTQHPEFCVLTLADQPILPVVRVSSGQSTEKNGVVLRYQEHQTTIASPDGSQVSLVSATTTSLPLFPVPDPSCLGAEPANCSFLFQRNVPLWWSRPVPLGRDVQDWLPDALGLATISPNNRIPIRSEEAVALVERSLAKLQARNLAAMEAILANMTGQHDDLALRGTNVDEVALARRLPAVIAVIADNLAKDGPARANALGLARFVLMQPPAVVDPHTARFEEISANDREFWELWVAYKSRKAALAPPDPPGPDDRIVITPRR